MGIEVRVAGRGSTLDDQVIPDPTMVAHCDVCDADVELVVSMTGGFACKECIRLRLDATSIAAWQLRDAGGQARLPWGKISG